MTNLGSIVFKYCPPAALKLLAKMKRLLTNSLALALKGSASPLAVRCRIDSGFQRSGDVALARDYGMQDVAEWADAFAEYSTGYEESISISWAARPYPGNVGDWLGPYLIRKVTAKNANYVNLNDKRAAPHLLTVGSILTFANKHSTVIGAGFNSKNDRIETESHYISVRGKLTQNRLNDRGVKPRLPPCDPGFFLPFLYRPNQERIQGETVFVPHVNHVKEYCDLSNAFDMIAPYARTAFEIEELVQKLHRANKVITSAMHIFIICYSYGIPVALVRPVDFFGSIPGDGFKYLDMSSVISEESFLPVPVELKDGTQYSEQLRFYENHDQSYFQHCFNDFENFLSTK